MVSHTHAVGGQAGVGVQLGLDQRLGWVQVIHLADVFHRLMGRDLGTVLRRAAAEGLGEAVVEGLEVGEAKEENCTETALDVRTSLMGPLAGLGDAIVWVLLPTVLGAIAGYQAQNGSVFGMILAMAVNVALWMVFWKLAWPVYQKGVSFITDRSASLHNLTEVCSILGIIVLGAMVASTVNVNITYSWTVGDLTQNLGDLLNTIIPCFGNVVTTAILYWALGRKKMTSGRLIWIVIIVAIVLGALGICG